MYIRRQHGVPDGYTKDIRKFISVGYAVDTRWLHDCYTASCGKYDGYTIVKRRLVVSMMATRLLHGVVW